jgi:hypothetical protein
VARPEPPRSWSDIIITITTITAPAFTSASGHERIVTTTIIITITTIIAGTEVKRRPLDAPLHA